MELEDGQRNEIREKLKWLMVLRVLVVTLLLGTSVVLQIVDLRQFRSATLFSFLIAATYFLTIIYSLAINRVRAVRAFAVVQLILDLIFETVLVAATGGIESPFSPFYMITILAASAILDRKGGALTGALAGIFYGLVVDSQYLGLIPILPPSPYGGSETLYLLFLNITAFVVVAYLAGSLTEKLKETRRSLVEKTTGLEDLKAFHENVVQSISSGLLTTDVRGVITSINGAGCDITGYSPVEAVGKSWSEFFEAEDVQGWGPGFPQLTGPVRLDRKFRKKDGSRLLLGMTVSPLRTGEGQISGAVWAFQDLTRIREMEDEIKRKTWLATIGEMAAGMAHEIRNPLASISGTMQVIKAEQELKPNTAHLVDIGLEETERLNSIVSSFLRYARPAPLIRTPCELHQLLEQVTELFHAGPEGSHHKVVKRFAPERFLLHLDVDQMKQVFWNLMINAAQAMPEGGMLEIETRRVVPKRAVDRSIQAEHPWVQVSFSDTGVGIPEDLREKIFFPFFTTKQKGSGLGLSIVHRIVEDHGGRIHLSSRPGEGTTVNLLLPLEAESPNVSGAITRGDSGAQHFGG